MTSSSFCRWLLPLWLAYPLAWAGLGDAQSSIEGERARMHALRAVAHNTHYSVHELTTADGSRVRQYVGGGGRVFAVAWSTFFKPDLASLLGPSYASYSEAEHAAVLRGGIQRQFRHQEADLVVRSSAHMNVYRGFAYRPSLTPQGVSLQSLDRG